MNVCLPARTKTWLGVSILLLTLAEASRAACPGALVGTQHQITAAETTRCEPAAGESVEVTSTGSITLPGGIPPIGVSGLAVGDIKNAGSLSSGPSVGAIEATSSATVRSITNTGSIYSDGDGGIYIHDQSLVSHGIANSGRTEGFYGGIYVYDYGQVDGGIVNSGLATGRSGIFFDHDAVLNGGIVNTATGQATGTSGSGIDIYYSTASGGIVNAGQVTGSDSGISIYNSSLTGGVSNSGTAIGSVSGVSVYYASLTGGLRNTGTITGGDYGLYARTNTFSGGIFNSGRIEGTGVSSVGASLDAHITGGLVNALGGVISGDREGLSLNGRSLAGGIVNSGDILGRSTSDGFGLYMHDGQLSGGIVNTATGRISGGGYAGLRLAGGTLSGGVHNAGLISGGLYYQGIYLSGTQVTGGLYNSGRVLGGAEDVGIEFSGGSLAGGLDNAGTVSGGMGIRFLVGTLVDGDITNSGTISGATAGLRIDDTATFASAASKIVNSGVITGADYSLRFGALVDRVVDNAGILQGDVRLGASHLRLLGNSARVIGNTAGGSGSSVRVEGNFASEGTFSVQTFDIASQGRFRMNHDVTAAFTNTGTLAIAAGMAPSITGDYHQAPGAVFELGLESATRYGQLLVNGNATLDPGASVHVDVTGAPSFGPGAIVPDVLRATGTLAAGTPVVTDNSYLFDFTSSTARDPKALDLVINAVPNAVRTAVNTQGNTTGTGAAAVIDGFLAGGVPAGLQDVVATLGRLGSAAQVSDAVRQMTPAHAGGGAQATNNMLHGLHRIIQARTEDNRGLSSGDATAQDRYLWVKPFVNEGSQGTRNGVDGFDSRSRGFVLGLDGATGERTRLGGSLAYVRSDVDTKSSAAPQGTDIASYALIGYGTWKLDADTDINYQLDAAKHDNKGWRFIPFMGSMANASYGARTLHAGVGAGRRVSLSDITSVTPSLRVDYTRVRTDGYAESGAGGLNLNVAASAFEELMLSGDAKIVHEISPGIRLTANAAIGYDFKSSQAQATAAFSGGGPAFVTRGLNPSPWLARLGGGVVLTRWENTELTARYDAEAKPSGYRSHTLSLRWRKAF